MEIELGGWSFYRKGAEETDDAELGELFKSLAEMEHEHLQLLATRYHVPAPDLGTGDVPDEVAALYAGVRSEPKTAVELLEVAVGLEERAKAFFADRASLLQRGSSVWRLYRELEAEEHEHVALIETELERRKAGLGGLL
jgi:rubrerythrin